MEDKTLIVVVLIALGFMYIWGYLDICYKIDQISPRSYVTKIDSVELDILQNIVDIQERILKKLNKTPVKAPSSDCDPGIEMNIGD